MTTKHELLDAAKKATADRGLNYGKPEANFDRIAARWRVHLKNRFGVEVAIDATSVALMCADLKMARLENQPNHEDSWVDLAGYAACGAEIAVASGAPTLPSGNALCAARERVNREVDSWTVHVGGRPWLRHSVLSLLDRAIAGSVLTPREAEVAASVCAPAKESPPVLLSMQAMCLLRNRIQEQDLNVLHEYHGRPIDKADTLAVLGRAIDGTASPIEREAVRRWLADGAPPKETTFDRVALRLVRDSIKQESPHWSVAIGGGAWFRDGILRVLDRALAGEWLSPAELDAIAVVIAPVKDAP